MPEGFLPAPPVSADANLRDQPLMPLDVEQFLNSEISSCKDAGLFRAAFLLRCIAWQRVPAGSVPDDDVMLSRLLYLDIRTWRRLRARGVLREWVLHSDGRWYHPEVTKAVLDVLAERAKRKAQAAKRAEARRQRQWRLQRDHSAMVSRSSATPKVH